MFPARALASVICIAAAIAGTVRPALAQSCSHNGRLVTCDDGRRGLLSGNLIVWADGTRSSASPESVQVGQGVLVGGGGAMVPLNDPNAPGKTRCVTLDDVSYCFQ
jgi:hypothetical protein